MQKKDVEGMGIHGYSMDRQKLAARMRPPGNLHGLIEEVVPDQLLEQLITVELADQAAGIVVIGDIGGVLRKQIADDLVDRVVTLFAE